MADRYDEVANAAHYHAWQLRQVDLKFWGNRGADPPWVEEPRMAYVAWPTPYAVRQTAQYQLPRYDSDLSFGSKGGQVLQCDGGPGCPWLLHKEVWGL